VPSSQPSIDPTSVPTLQPSLFNSISPTVPAPTSQPSDHVVGKISYAVLFMHISS
jgi:hypothetical protein